MFNRVCLIYTLTDGISDDMGGFTTDFEITPETNMCSIVEATSREIVNFKKREMDVRYIMKLPHLTIVKRGDKIVMDDGFDPIWDLFVEEIISPSKFGETMRVALSGGQRSI